MVEKIYARRFVKTRDQCYQSR